MASRTDRSVWTAAVLAVAMIYAGLLAGVSFLATTVKFSAPSLQLPVALDVGRYTFAALNKMEWLAAAILLALCIVARARWSTIGAALVVAVLAADTLWLLPALDARVGLILSGQSPEPSPLHWIYGVMEVVKLALLIAVGVLTACRLTRNAAR